MLKLTEHEYVRIDDIRQFSFDWIGIRFDPLNLFVKVGFRDGSYSEQIRITEDKMLELKALQL